MKQVTWQFVTLCVLELPGQQMREQKTAPATPASVVDAKLIDRIERLVGELGDPQFAVREAATNGLMEIGPPAVGSLRRALKSEDAEVRARAQLLLRAIPDAQGEVVDGVRLRLSSEQLWIIPKHGDKRDITISLEITNLAPQKRRFSLLDAVCIVLRDRTGNLPLQGGRSALLNRASYTPSLAQGESYRIDYLDAKLFWDRDGKVRLQGKDGFGGVWYYTELSPGSYWLFAGYATGQVFQEKGVVPVWVGQGSSNAVSIKLK
jgi:hypothetical protein